ncbi:MAG: hypothetical protein QOH89_2996 [Pseudonocardiales bacterium]|nr:hypothetical protein [Pseudonocardiales bacterium]
MRRLSGGLAAAALLAACTSSGSAGAPALGVQAAATSVPRIAGCPLFPADNPWRRDISRAELSRHSAAWVRSVGLRTDLHPDFGENQRYGIPFQTVPATQPEVPIRFTAYGNESDPGPYPVPLGARVEAGGDRHVLVASADCHLYELYHAYRTDHGWRAASGAVFDLRSNALRHAGWTSADAAGLPILPGLVRASEVRAGHIDHALRFTVSLTQKGYIHPATHQAGDTTSAAVPPMGARFRLKASYRLGRFHGQALVILRCLKKYGMLVADNGSDWFISGAPSHYWNDDDLNQLKTVPGRAFEVVATGRVHR